ncbi:MAG TPA: transglutaminase-like domain-containing protein [Pirellulales bacterium]|nr:transglutaminase-like domain-containing protein [Pirellulales bacterium]
MPRATAATVVLLLLAHLACAPHRAYAQFKEQPITKGPQFGTPVSQKLQVGVVIKAEGGPCGGLMATVPVPCDWPEQTVKIVDEELLSAPSVRYRTTAGHLKQMLIEVAQLPTGQVAKAIVTLEVSHAPQLAPADPSVFKIPKKVDRQLVIYTGSSPMIETRHAKIASLAKQLAADQETAWGHVQAIYEWVAANIKIKAGDLKGAAKALNDKGGDVEDLTSLFIALCRASKIPARTVWVPQSCYAEFYLVDEDGTGYWFPVQLGEIRSFGRTDETRPILLKGDNFKDPERPREHFRFVPEFVKGSAVKGGGRPKVEFVRKTAGEP